MFQFVKVMPIKLTPIQYCRLFFSGHGVYGIMDEHIVLSVRQTEEVSMINIL